MNRPTDRYLRFPRVGLRRISGNGLSGCGHAIPPTGGRKLTASEYQSQMVPFAMELANRISLRLEHHKSLTSFEIEDIEQELLTYVLERASQFDPSKGSIEAFVTQMMRTAAATLIRGSNRRRSNPPPGRVVDSLSKMVEGPIASPKNSTAGSPPPMALVVARRNLATHFVTSSWRMPLSIRSTLCPAATVALRGFYERTTKTRSQTNSVYRDEKFRRF